MSNISKTGTDTTMGSMKVEYKITRVNHQCDRQTDKQTDRQTADFETNGIKDSHNRRLTTRAKIIFAHL